ncbi:restriction endonuclease type II-like protein [Phakopsora pachyrhizi]|uniref:DNA excision repair protein ERCC-1 n=1 Tax=Phakopsora pachyrhizi TaxID=170000 RepID=A0AAV0AM36_PHAPC|nr:restriction endonuclease type II-like protein [Phakopsora pachyrhizi]
MSSSTKSISRDDSSKSGRRDAGSSSSSAMIVNKCQKGNPILSSIQSVPWQFGETLADYQFGQTSCCLFLSLKYHKLHPEYLHQRIKRLGAGYCDLRVLLVLCDVDDHESSIREITKICVVNRLTLVVGWSNLEISRYLQLYKTFEQNKSSTSLIKPKVENDYLSQLNNVLTSVRGINRTDVLTLASNFGSFKQIVEAHPSQFSLCPGLGEKKVKRLADALHSDFLSGQKSSTSNQKTNSLIVTSSFESQAPKEQAQNVDGGSNDVEVDVDKLEVFDFDQSEIKDLETLTEI